MRVVGTAGHVDHGKSTLIRALTGIDPDRLQEEKQRGMTIDLGFAWLRLPNGTEVSIVDVPGHERFVHNMLAGVGGIDVALLVVAADEGIMPQTREHLAILDLLGISNGVVALTKCDLVDQDWLELVQVDVAEQLAHSSLAHAPIIPCSATTRSGLDELTAALEDALARERTHPSTGRPRLAIDRVFTVAGYGTVVTGTLVDGELYVGQDVEVQPGQVRTRVRGLQTHKKSVDHVTGGTRVAANLGGVAVGDLYRGQVLSLPGALAPSLAFDAQLRLVADAPTLRHNAEVVVHTGAAETLARVSLLDRDDLDPGQEAWAQLRLRQPLALARGDLFVVRQPSPSLTVGGGTIVDPHARRHRRRQAAILDHLALLAHGSPDDVLLGRLRAQEPLAVGPLVRSSELPPVDARVALAALLASGAALALDSSGAQTVDDRTYVASREGWESLAGRVSVLLGDYHAAYQLRGGFPTSELRGRLGLDGRAILAVIGQLKRAGTIVEEGPLVRLASHSVQLSPEQAALRERLVGLLRAAGATPPDRQEWEASLHVSPELTDALIAAGTLREIAPGLLYDARTLDEMVDRVRVELKGGPRTVSQLREALGISRKYAVPLLTYTDQRKITRRVGDERVLY